MDARQRQLFYEKVGFQEFESYCDYLIEQDKSELQIDQSEYQLWDSGFAVYCMTRFEYSANSKGIRIEL